MAKAEQEVYDVDNDQVVILSPSNSDHHVTTFRMNDQKHQDQRAEENQEVVQEEDWWPKEKRYCFGKLTKGWFISSIAMTVMLVILIITLILIFVVGRSIAQHAVDDSEIQVSRMFVDRVGADHMVIEMEGMIQNFAMMEGTLSDVSLTLSHQNSSFGTLFLPGLALAAAGSTPLLVSQQLDVYDFPSFSNFTFDMVSNPVTKLTLSGKVTLKSLGISFSDLKMSKDIEIYGLNSFLGSITDDNSAPVIESQNVLSATNEQIRLGIDTCLTNTGVIAFRDLGQLQLDIFYKDVNVGYATVEGENGGPLALNPGRNCWSMAGYIERNAENQLVVQDLIGKVASTKLLTLTLRGNQATSTYPILIKALSQLETSVTFSPLSVMVSEEASASNFNATEFSEASFGVKEDSIMQYVSSLPVKNLPYAIQAVFNPTASLYDYLINPLGSGSVMGGEPIPEDSTCAALGLAKASCVSEIDLSSTTYIDVKALVLNPVNTTLKVFGTSMDVFFSQSNKWDCHVPKIDMSDPANTVYKKAEFLRTCLNVTDLCSFNDAGHGSFHMATLLQESTSIQDDGSVKPLVEIPPFGKKFLHQRLCLSSATVSWITSWLDKQIKDGVDEAPYYMKLDAVGTMDVQLDNFRTKMDVEQEIPVYGYYYQKPESYPYKPVDWIK